MADSFMNRFDIGTTQFGIFTALYYYTYTFMQIPAGLMADKFKLKKVILSAISIVTIGILLEALGKTLMVMEIGRLIMGFGCAFAYICALKTASLWLPERHFGLAICVTDTIGMISGLMIGLYITKLTVTMGNTDTYLFVAVIAVIIAGLIYTMMKGSNKGKLNIQRHQEKNPIWETIRKIIKNKQIWLIGIVGCLYYIPSSVFLDVWGIPYLSHTYNLTTLQSSHLTALFTLGWIAFGAVVGFISDKIQSRKLIVLGSIAMVTLLFSLIVLPPYFGCFTISHNELGASLFFIGVFTSAHPLVFALAKENFHNSIAATVVAITNMLIMCGGIIFQPLIGYLINYRHHLEFGTTSSHAYTTVDYSFGMLILPIFLLISFVLAFFIKDSLYKHKKSA